MTRFVRPPVLVSALAAIGSVVAFAQTPSTSSSEGLELLTRVAKKYAEAKSYYIESVEERTSRSEYRHDWQKTLLTAAESPGDRYYYEGRSETGSIVRVTDGKTVWTYRVNEHRYTAKPVGVKESGKSKVLPFPEMALTEAEYLRKKLGTLAKSFKSADQLPDAKLKVSGHKISCYVVRLRSADQKRVSPKYSFDKTIWIDKDRQTVLRIVEHAHTYMTFPGGASMPLDEDITTTFPNTDLDGPVRDTLFSFVPPQDAKRIEDFPDPRKFGGETELMGEQAPPLQLKSADGKVVSLESFRGKPVLIDIWATWCAPCVEGLPKLDKIYQEAKDKGLVLVSVDRDEEAKTATDFLSKKGYAWPNFHDDGDIEKLMGESGIPQEVLVDAQGKIVYDGAMDEDELRTEIAKLGPEYASLRPKPKDAPCAVKN